MKFLLILLLVLTLSSSCNMFGESEIDEGFVFAMPTDGLLFWLDAATSEDITFSTGSDVDYWYSKDTLTGGGSMDCNTTFPQYQDNLLNGLGGIISGAGPSCSISHTASAPGAGEHFTFIAVVNVGTLGDDMRIFDGFEVDALGGAFAYSTGTGSSSGLGNPFVVTYELETQGVVNIYKNSNLLVEGASVGAANLFAVPAASLSNFTADSTFHELLFYDRWLNEGERRTVENYLMTKWGLK